MRKRPGSLVWGGPLRLRGSAHVLDPVLVAGEAADAAFAADVAAAADLLAAHHALVLARLVRDRAARPCACASYDLGAASDLAVHPLDAHLPHLRLGRAPTRR